MHWHAGADDVVTGDDEWEVFVGVYEQADRVGGDVKVDDLTGLQVIDPIEALHREVGARQLRIEMPEGDTHAPGRCMVEDGWL